MRTRIPRSTPVSPSPVVGARRDPGEGVAHGVDEVTRLPPHVLLLRRELVVGEHLEAVGEEAVVEEGVRQEEAEDGHEEVQRLAEDEAVVVDVVLVVDVRAEELENSR